MHLTSIQVLSHLHPGPKIRIWLPCMLHLTLIWISLPPWSQELRCHPGPSPPTSRSPDVSHLQLGPVSLPSRSQYPRLIPIQVTSRLPSRSRQLHITSIQVPSHHQPRPDIHVSSPARSRYSCLTIQVTSHPHLHSATCISASSRSNLIPSRPQGLCLTSIKAPFHSHPYLKICIAPASKFYLICTQIFISPLCHVSPPFKWPGLHLVYIQVPSHTIQVPKFVSRLHPGHNSSPPRSRYSCHISIQVTSRAPSRSRELHLSSIQVPSHLTQDRRLVFHLHPSTTSPAFESQDSRLTLTSFYVTSYLHPGPKNHASPLPMSLLTSSTFSTSFATHLHPGCVSPPSRT